MQHRLQQPRRLEGGLVSCIWGLCHSLMSGRIQDFSTFRGGIYTLGPMLISYWIFEEYPSLLYHFTFLAKLRILGIFFAAR